MATNFHSAQRRGFVKGSRQQVYTCRCCKRKTRPTGTGDNDGVELCVECYDLAGEENYLSDDGEFYGSPQEVLDNIKAVVDLGGDASCWDALKAKAEALLKPAEPTLTITMTLSEADDLSYALDLAQQRVIAMMEDVKRSSRLDRRVMLATADALMAQSRYLTRLAGQIDAAYAIAKKGA